MSFVFSNLCKLIHINWSLKSNKKINNNIIVTLSNNRKIKTTKILHLEKKLKKILN